MQNASIWKKYSYAWVTIAFFLFSLIGHWMFGWWAFVEDQAAHSQPVDIGSYLVLMSRDTLENWQSEFLQLLWQVGGLAYLFYLGSPQSKEGDDRVEAKLDEILRLVSPEKGQRIIENIDEAYAGRGTDPGYKREFS